MGTGAKLNIHRTTETMQLSQLLYTQIQTSRKVKLVTSLWKQLISLNMERKLSLGVQIMSVFFCCMHVNPEKYPFIPHTVLQLQSS